MDEQLVNSTRLQFRTPYFDISVGETTDSITKLPPLLHRLVESVQITQTMEMCSKIMATITFLEGSREPFNVLDADTSSVYLNSDGSKLDNTAGMLADLVFSGSGGAVNFKNLQASSVISNVSAAASLINSFSSKLEDFSVTPATKVPGSRYVFKEGNYIKVTWGYRENKAPASFVGIIKVIQYEFPENDAAKMILIVESFGSTLDQIAALEPSSFYNKSQTGVDEVGNPTYKLEGLTTPEILKKLAEEAGFDLIISDKFEAEKAGKDKHYVLPLGYRFTQFLSDFARRHAAVFMATFNPKTYKPTIIFTKLSDFYGIEILPAKLFRWRGQDSIIKSFAIRFDYGSLTGAGVAGITNKGAKQQSSAEDSTAVLLADAKAAIDTRTATDKNGAKSLKDKVAKGQQLGSTSYIGGGEPPTNTKAIADNTASCAIRNAIAIEMTTIGHPSLRPGTISISGVAKRYDAPYFIKVCTHNINQEGYTCNITAMGHLSANGYAHPDAVKVQQREDSKIDVLLTTPLTTNSATDLNKKTSEAIKGS